MYKYFNGLPLTKSKKDVESNKVIVTITIFKTNKKTKKDKTGDLNAYKRFNFNGY